MFHLSADAQNDEEFLITGPTSRLSSLFTDDSSNMIADLKYVAPKQPQMESDGIDAKATNLIVLYARAISLFGHDHNAVKNYGKAMCCITKDVKDVFVLLIYKTKQQVISQTIINENFSINVQPNNFAVFIDDKSIQRSVHISSNYEHFLTQIGICRAFLAFKQKCELSYFTQDISLGKNGFIGERDTIKFSLNSWLVENFKRGIQLGAQKDGIKLTLLKSSKSWEMGLVGGQISLRRIIFVPNSQVYATDKSSMIAYEVLIEKIYKDDEDINEYPPVKPSNADFKEKIDERKKSRSPTPSPTPSSPSKASLISRMAKVGQAMLPTVPSLHHSIAPTDSESDIEDINDSKSLSEMSDSTEESKTKLSQVKWKCEKINKKLNIDHKAQTCMISGVESSNLHGIHQENYVPGSMFQYGSLPPGSLVSYHPINLPHSYQGQHASSSFSAEPILSLLLSESRSQSTDMRITLSKLTDKIDQLDAKIKATDVQGFVNHHTTALAQMSLTHSKFDPNELLLQITTLVQENEDMKREIDKISKRNDELNYDYAVVMKKNQSLLEEKNELLTLRKGSGSPEKTRISLQEVLTIQEEKVKIKAQLEDAMKAIKSLENESNKSKNSQLTWEQNMDSLRANLEQERKARASLDEKLTLKEKEMSSLEVKVKDLQESHSKLSSSCFDKDVLINNTEEQKRKLEEKILLKEQKMQLLVDENDGYKEIVSDMQKKCKQLELDQLSRVDDSSVKNKELPTLVKQIMNATYKKLKGLFNAAETYEGKQVLENMLTVIRDTTLKYVENSDNPSALQLKGHSIPTVNLKSKIEMQELDAKDSARDSEGSEKDAPLIKVDKIPECVPIFYREGADLSFDNASLENFNSPLMETKILPNLHTTNNNEGQLSVPIENSIPSMPTNDPSNNEQIPIKSSDNDLPSSKCLGLGADSVSSNGSMYDVKQEFYDDESAQKDGTNLNEIEKCKSELIDEDFTKPVIELPNEITNIYTETELPTSHISENREPLLNEDWRPIPPPVPSLFSDSEDDDDNWLP